MNKKVILPSQEKTNIVKELLNNSTSEGIKSLLYNYNNKIIKDIKFNDDKLIRLDNCITYIQGVSFNISGWMLFDIPVFYSHCFWNTYTKQAFDLAVWDIGEVIPRYLDNEFCENDAETIQEAIHKYDIVNCLNANR